MDAAPIRQMFDTLVSGYDRFNALSSMGLDSAWRSRVAQMFSPNGHVLDVGTGTGDLAKTLAVHGCQVIGVDFSPNMITAAKAKLKGFKNISLDVASAEQLPFEPRTFDGITSAFVIRNLNHGGLLAPSLSSTECSSRGARWFIWN
jgi:demethylmenaquinone methyltransferase / 2-methoxy-6-polyprenyl-1,4-benzoquinol methylase